MMSNDMTIHFTKMHGLGNDFIVIDGIHQQIKLNPIQIAKMANRNTGIGFDQCLLIEPSQNENIDFQYRIFNADGQEVGQCGNGARCIALFAKHYGLTKKNKLTVATKTTHMELAINSDDTVSVNMGKPMLSPSEIPLNAPKQLDQYSILLNNEQIVNFHSISVGNPHAVLVVPDVAKAPVQTIGKQICFHPIFPEQTNVEFMQILNQNQIKLRVYERGCGETIACGSGAVAAAAIGRLFYNLADQISISLLGGDLRVSWPQIGGDITLTGPAAFVFEGKMIP
jgi:diaminopimelate epimerase